MINEVIKHLSPEVLSQITRQLGAMDVNQVAKAAQGAIQILTGAVAQNANDQQRGGGLFGAIQKDHDGGILGDLLGVLNGQRQVNNPSTMNGEGILRHLLGDNQVKAAQVIQQNSGLDFFKSGVLMQLLAPIVMGVVGQKQKSSGLDLGGLAQILLGGAGQQQAGQARQGGGGNILEKLLDRDGDGNMMDDLLGMGMKILRNK